MEKITVEVRGRRVRIMKHMLEDAKRHGATQTVPVIRNIPKELIKPVHPLAEVPISPLPAMEITPELLKTARKAPVRSKSKK